MKGGPCRFGFLFEHFEKEAPGFCRILSGPPALLFPMDPPFMPRGRGGLQRLRPREELQESDGCPGEVQAGLTGWSEPQVDLTGVCQLPLSLFNCGMPNTYNRSARVVSFAAQGGHPIWLLGCIAG